MSRFIDKGDPRDGGFHILQHKGYIDKGWSVDLRGSIGAVRVTGRDDRTGGEGHWQYDIESPGDINGGQLWYTNDPHRRPSMWRFATPVIAQRPDGLGTPTESNSAKSCAIMPDGGRVTMLPVVDENWNPETRFKTLTANRPKNWQKFPLGTIGISLTADYENKQEDLFFPTNAPLVAVNRLGDIDMGSRVFDMGPGFVVDPDRYARLQSHFWVIRKPKGCVDYFGTNSIAWNISPSGCKDTRGGLVIDDAPTKAAKSDKPPDFPPTPTFGHGTASEKAGTPSTGGAATPSLGRGGAAGVGEPFLGDPKPGPGSTVAEKPHKEKVIAHMGRNQSGPFHVGSDSDKHQIGTDEDGHVINAGHLDGNFYLRYSDEIDGPLNFDGGYEGADAGPKRMIVHFEYLGTASHGFVCGDRLGKYFWHSYCFLYCPPTYENSNPVPSGGGDGGNGGGIPGGGIPSPAAPVTLVPFSDGPSFQPWQTGMPLLNFGASSMELASSCIMGRPQFASTGAVDFRNLLYPKDKPANMMDRSTPIIGRIEAFGQQLATGWVYTNERIKYEHTADGGWCVMPPEIGLEDNGTTYAPVGRTLSTVYFGVLTNNYFAAGIPDLTTGAFKTGFRWGKSGNYLNFEAINTTSSIVTIARYSTSTDYQYEVQLGQGGLYASVIGTIYEDLSSAGTGANTLETTLASVSITANSLNNVGKGLTFRAWGTTASNSNIKTIRAYYAGTLIASNDVVTNPNGLDWEIEGEIDAQSGTVVQSSVRMNVGAVKQSVNFTSVTADYTAANTLSVSGQNGTPAANDIVCQGFTVKGIT